MHIRKELLPHDSRGKMSWRENSQTNSRIFKNRKRKVPYCQFFLYNFYFF